MSEKSLTKQLYEDYSSILKEAKSMGCNEILALRNIPLKSMEEIVNVLKIVSDLKERNIDLETLENYMKFEDECVKNNFTFKSILEAREKQIVKKPVPHPNDYGITYCPNCGTCFGGLDCAKYCWDCGQKLDWE